MFSATMANTAQSCFSHICPSLLGFRLLYLSILFSVHLLYLTSICVSRSGPGKVRDVTGNAKYAKTTTEIRSLSLYLR